MKEKENAVPAAATVRDGKTEQTAERTIQAVNSVHDSIMNMAKSQGFIESFLLHGASNAIPTNELLKLTGLDLRQLRKQVELERRNGTLILTQPQGGYFLPGEGEAGKDEIRTFYLIQRSKALSLLKTIKAAREALGEIDGQMEIV